MYVGDDEMYSFNDQPLHGSLYSPHAGGSDEAIIVKTQRLPKRFRHRLLIIDDEDIELRRVASKVCDSELLRLHRRDSNRLFTVHGFTTLRDYARIVEKFPLLDSC